MSYLDWQLGQIATQVPGATSILFAHKINFCCNGHKALKDVLAIKGLNAAEFDDALQVLAKRNENSTDWSLSDNKEIIDHILSRYHEVHREQLTELIRLAARVETVHGNHELCPNGLAIHLTNMKQELEQHMQKEESILFPMLTSDYPPVVQGPISVMMVDHEEHIKDIERIYALTQDLVPHSEACNTWRALYVGLQEFVSDINMHIHIENNILFSRALEKFETPKEKEGMCCGSCS